MDLARCRELGFKLIGVCGGYTYPEILYALQELAKMVDKDAGGILFHHLREIGRASCRERVSEYV